MEAGQLGAGRPGQRGTGARDLPAGGREHPGLEVEVGAEQVEDHLGAAARRSRGHQPAVPVDDRRQVPGALAGHLADHVLRDRCERDGLVDGEEWQPVPQTGLDQIVRDVAELRLARREPGDTGARQDPYEGLRVRRAPVPGQTRQHQLAARQVAAGVPQVGGHHAPDRTVQLVVAAEQPQAQRVGVQQCAQPHLVAADLIRWYG